MWDALCRLEAALRRPLPDVDRQTQTVMQRGVELQAAWDRHASILAQHLSRGQWWVVERANSPRADATTTAWQQRLRAGREALAPYID
jgi:hypothetical protein